MNVISNFKEVKKYKNKMFSIERQKRTFGLKKKRKFEAYLYKKPVAQHFSFYIYALYVSAYTLLIIAKKLNSRDLIYKYNTLHRSYYPYYM